jgi:hypothetical protein
MNTPLLALPFSALGQEKKKRVLLVDGSPAKRDLRAETMRKLGMQVDCAADIAEARSWWRADLYDLVLINLEKGGGHRDRFCEDVRAAIPPQRLAFLVGKPEYLADSPNGSETLLEQDTSHQTLVPDARAGFTADLGNLSQRWGILEASRRISAVRSLCTARTKAMRDTPIPPRDSDGRTAKRAPASTSLDDLLREVMQ